MFVFRLGVLFARLLFGEARMLGKHHQEDAAFVERKVGRNGIFEKPAYEGPAVSFNIEVCAEVCVFFAVDPVFEDPNIGFMIEALLYPLEGRGVPLE